MLRTSMTVIGLAIVFHVVATAGSMMLENQGAVWGRSAAAADSWIGASRPDENDSANSAANSKADTIELQGTVVYKDLEGGFFAIDGDDGQTYDPVNLPESFKQNGMRVKATVRVKSDAAGIHMVGDIVEIVDIVESNGQDIPREAKDNPSNAHRKFQTKTGKTIIVSETHPVGRSLSKIVIKTENFQHDFKEVYEDQDPISDIFLADLDGNGFDELYIVTTSSGSGSYGTVIGFASNKDKSLSRIHFSTKEKGDQDFRGYRGHDIFKIEDHKLVRLFPLYNEGDTNQKPTGGTRKLTYDLLPGEAIWHLKVTKSVTLNNLLNSELEQAPSTILESAATHQIQTRLCHLIIASGQEGKMGKSNRHETIKRRMYEAAKNINPGYRRIDNDRLWNVGKEGK